MCTMLRRTYQSRCVDAKRVGELSGLTRQRWEQGPLKLLGPRGRRLLLLVSLAETTFTAKCIRGFCCKASTHVEQQTGKAISENTLL